MKNLKNSPNYIFILVILALLIDNMLYGVIVPIVPFYATSLGITTTQIGWIFGIYSLALLLASTPMGWAVDAYGYRPLLTAGMLGLALSTAAFIYSGSLPLLLLSRTLQGTSAAATWAAGLALISEIFPSEVRGQKMGLAMTATGLGVIVGPVLGGFLYQAAGYTAPFVPFLVLGLLEGILFYFSPLPGRSSSTSSGKIGFSILLKNRNLFWASMISVVGAFGFSMLEPTLPLQMGQRFGLSSAGVGAIFGAMSLAFSLSQPFFGSLSDRRGRKPLIVIGLVAVAVLSPGLALAPSLWVLFLVIGLLGIGTGAFATPNLPLLAESTEAAFSRTPDAAVDGGDDAAKASDSPLGTAFGIFNTVYSFGLMAGPLVGSAVTQRFGFLPLLLLFSLMLLVTAAGSARWITETLRQR
ncbi:MAG: MFS transporter [Firmicutes bacterium]|nr:MFS transporter [Bacillota bacterium]